MVSFPKISPNLLLGVGGIIAAVFLINQVRKAGGDLQKALTDIQLPEIKFPDVFAQPSIIDTTPQIVTPDLTAQGALTVPELEGATSIVQTETGVFVDGVQLRTITPVEEKSFIDTIGDFFKGIIPSVPVATAEEFPEVQAPIQPILEDRPISLAEFAAPIPTIEPSVVSLLPTEQQFQVFAAEGSPATQFTIQENPIDTLSEVLTAFPQLTASQASDFLSEFSGILPSELALVDPDIKNIVAAGGDIPIGEQIQVETVGISDLKSEELKAAEFTCKEFGLNCDIVDASMA